MARVRSGGLSSLTRLGSIDGYGNETQLSDRAWSTDENENDDMMVEFTRNVLGEHDNILFVIERNFNRNVCYYQLDPETGKVTPAWLIIPDHLDVSNMSIFDVDNELREEELTMMESRVYGVDMIDESHFTVRALKGEVFTIHRTGDTARATVDIDDKSWVVRGILIHTRPGLVFGIPTVTEIHVEVEDKNERVFHFFFAV